MLDIWGAKREIIGIAGDVKDAPADAAAVPAFYLPTTQQIFPTMTVALKTTGDPLSLVNAARAAVQSLDAELPIAEVRALDDVTAAAYGERRFMLALVGLFGALALTLSAIGAYGVMSYAAAQRQREFGVRLALGADASQILRLVLTQGLRLTTIGLTLGLALALALGQLMRSLLYGISPTDTATFVLVASITLMVALAASLLPARRAARADPMRALRIE
jgi:ABC-type antimicrobial peptide transport system permease subunit